MRAACLLAPHQITCDEIDDPQLAGGHDEQVIVKTLISTICGSDLHVIESDLAAMPYPCTHGYPGHETVGVVTASNSEAVAVGEVVLGVPDLSCSAAFADYQLLPSHFTLRIPTELPPDAAIMAQQLGTVLFALKRFGNPTGEVATVIGAGTAGLFFANRLKALGCETVIVADLDRHRLERARRFGADVVALAPVDDVVAVTHDLSRGRGADVVIEAAGYESARTAAIGCVRYRGFLGLFGLPEQRGLAPFPFYDFFRKEATVRSVAQAQLEPGLASFREAVGLIATRGIPVSDLITHRLSIEHIDEAMRIAGNRDGGVGKVAVLFD